MKKLISTILIALLPIIAIAQTQQGYVKTKGYINKKGSRLPKATVIVDGGNSAKCNENGDFKLVGSKYKIKNVTKKGYVLTDPDQVNKTYNHSNSPLIFVMETPDEQSADKLSNERKIRRTLQRTLQQREDEIEALKEQNKISEEEYRKALQKIYDEQGKNEKLISEMAERYSKIDYDQISDFDREFNQYILNGELTKADSLLDTKGDINSHINQYFELQEDIKEKEKNLEKEKELSILAKEDLANRCEKKAEMFKIEYKNDSAAYYLELKASLDTTNVEWQLDAGLFIQDYLANYDKALDYYNCALRNAIAQYGESHEDVATSYNNIGYVFKYQGNYNDALNYHQKALEILLQVYDEFHPDVASSYNNIGSVLYSQGNYTDALNYYQKALEIGLQIYGESHPLVATSYNNIGLVYHSQGNYNDALNYHQKALEIQLQLFGESHPDVATSYNNIGGVLDSQGNYNEALNYYQKALEIYLQVYGESHPLVANSYNNIGYVYYSQGNYNEALNYLQRALEIRLQLFGESHPLVAQSYNNIGNVLVSQGNYNEALNYYQKALEIRLQLLGESHPDVVITHYIIAQLNSILGDFINAIKYCDKCLNNTVDVYGNYNQNVKRLYMGKYRAYSKLVVQDTSYISDFLKFMENIVFTATMVEGDTPASKQGLKGEYYLFEFGDWDMESLNDLFDKSTALKGKPKTLILMKDGKISSHYFEGSIGSQFGVKWISKEEKQQILEQYRKWKGNQK